MLCLDVDDAIVSGENAFVHHLRQGWVREHGFHQLTFGELTLPGHEPWSRTLTLDVSQRVHATLATSPLAAVPREEAGASAAPEADPAAEEENAAAARAAEENADDAVRTDPADEARPRRRGRRREGADTAIPLWD